MLFSTFPILSVIIFLPLAGAIAIAFTPRSRPDLARYLALSASGLAWIFSLVLVVSYILPTSTNGIAACAPRRPIQINASTPRAMPPSE